MAVNPKDIVVKGPDNKFHFAPGFLEKMKSTTPLPKRKPRANLHFGGTGKIDAAQLVNRSGVQFDPNDRDPSSPTNQKLSSLGLLDKEKGLVPQAQALGLEPQNPAQEGPSGLERTFDVLSRPLYGVANTFAELLGRTQDTPASNPAEAAWRGLSGQDKTTFSKMYLEDAANKEGATPGSVDSTLGALGLGLISDVVLDPTTYLGVGLAKDVGSLAAGGGKAAETVKDVSSLEKSAKAAETATKAGETAVKAGQETEKAGLASRIVQGLKDKNEAIKAKEFAVPEKPVLENGRILVAPYEPGAAQKLHDLEPLLAKGDEAKIKHMKDAEKAFTEAEKAAGRPTVGKEFETAKKEFAKADYLKARSEAEARQYDTLEAWTALQKSDPVAAKLQVKVLGKPVIQSKTLGKPLLEAEKAFKSTKAGKLLREGFVPGASNPVIHDLIRKHSNKGASHYEDSLKRIKKVFDGGTLAGVDYAKTTKADREAITRAVEAGTPKSLPPQLKNHYNFVKTELDEIANAEIAAGAMKPQDKVPNYVYQVHTNKMGTPKWGPQSLEKGKKYATLAEAEAAGARPVLDAADMLAMRTAKSFKQINHQNLLSEAADLFALKSHGKTKAGQVTKKLVEDRILVPGSKLRVGESGKKLLSGKYFDPEVASALEKTSQVFSHDPTTREFLKLFDKVQAKWKFLATAPNPGFQIRNAISDVFMNYLDGVVNPKRYQDAIDALSALNHEKAAVKNLLKDTKFGNLTGEDLFQLYEAQGLRSGYFHAETGVAENALGGKFSQTIRKGSEAREDWTRMAHFIDALEKEIPKSKTIDEAAAAAAGRVKRFNFDYQDLTNFERKFMKRVIPFYTFMRKNVPLQLEMLVTRPGRVVQVPVLERAISQALNGGDPMAQDSLPGITNVVPQWLRDLYPMQVSPETPTSDATFISPDLPYEQPAQFLGGFSRSPGEGQSQLLRQITGALTPALKAPIEYGIQEDIATGAPLSSLEVGGKDLGVGARVLANQAPVGQRLTSDLNRDSEHVGPRFTISVGGKTVEVPEAWINYATGAGIRKVTPARTKSEILRRDEPIKAQIKKARDKMKSPDAVYGRG